MNPSPPTDTHHTPATSAWGSPSQRGLLAAVITVGIWTSFIIIARASAAGHLSAFDIAWARFVGAGLVMLPWAWWWVRRDRARAAAGGPAAISSFWGLSPLPFGMTCWLGMAAGVGYGMLVYSGFFFAPAAHASVLMPGMLPLWTALLAAVFLGERITARRAGALSLLVLGAALVGGASLWRALSGGLGEPAAGPHPRAVVGDVLFMCSSFAFACYGITARKYRVGAVPATMAICVFCAFTYVPIYAVLVAAGLVPSQLPSAPGLEIAFQMAMQGLGSVVISGITFTLMVQHYGPTKTTLITAAVPGLSALGAVIFLGEPLNASLIAGLVCVSVGIIWGVGAASATRTP